MQLEISTQPCSIGPRYTMLRAWHTVPLWWLVRPRGHQRRLLQVMAITSAPPEPKKAHSSSELPSGLHRASSAALPPPEQRKRRSVHKRTEPASQSSTGAISRKVFLTLKDASATLVGPYLSAQARHRTRNHLSHPMHLYVWPCGPYSAAVFRGLFRVAGWFWTRFSSGAHRWRQRQATSPPQVPG